MIYTKAKQNAKQRCKQRQCECDIQRLNKDVNKSSEIYTTAKKGVNKGNDIYTRTYGVVVSMFDFHRCDRGSNPGRGGEIS